MVVIFSLKINLNPNLKPMRFILILLLFCVFHSSFGQKNTKKLQFQKVIQLAEQKYSAYISSHSDQIMFPRNTNPDGTLREVTSDDWTSGFFPGCLWNMYRLT